MYFATGSATTEFFTSGSGSLQEIWTSNTGGNAPHNNLPPYCPLYIWRRTA